MKEIFYVLWVDITSKNKSDRANISRHVQLREWNLHLNISTSVRFKESRLFRRFAIVDEFRNFHLLVKLNLHDSISGDRVVGFNFHRLQNFLLFFFFCILSYDLILILFNCSRFLGWLISCKDRIHGISGCSLLPFGSFCSYFYLTLFEL